MEHSFRNQNNIIGAWPWPW